MEASSTSNEFRRGVEEQIRQQRVHYVFAQSRLPIVISPAAAAVLSGALWNVVSRERVVAWVVGVGVLAFVRMVLVQRFLKATPTAAEVKGWERAFVGTAVAVALWWGAGGLWLLPEPLTERIVVFSFLMLMASGSAASYAPHPRTVALTLLAIAVPITVYFATVPDVLHRSLAFGSLMFLAATLRAVRTLGDFFAHSHGLAAELKRERDRAERLARLDPLTGLSNRRAFYELARAACRHAKRYQHPISLVMVDIDRFKLINDTRGHLAGDDVIRAVATLIRQEFRITDISCRFGGEEFLILLPETTNADAQCSAERLRSRVETTTLMYQGEPLRFTVSLGVATLDQAQTLEDLLRSADDALYLAKREGRNSVITASSQSGQLASTGS